MSLVMNKLALSLRPFGEVEQTSKYMVIVPPVGTEYYPVLLHCDYKNISQATHNIVKYLLECGTPPIVLITDGNQASIAASVASYLEVNEIVPLFNGILSMNNERFGFLQGFATYWNNLPFQLEERLAHIKFLGKYTNVGNGFAETLGQMFNKPVVSTHFVGAEQDYMDIKEFLACLAEEYPEYNYQKGMDFPGNFTRPNTDKRCVCCHKTGNDLQYFHAIQGNLCPTCIRKMRNRKGGINITNWYRLAVELKVERMNTSTANTLALWKKEPVCPDCGGKLTSKEYHEYHCDACGRTVWYKNKHYYRIVENLGTQFVQKISDDGKSLAGSWPLMKAVELMTCDECRKVVIDFTTRYEANTNTTRVVCKRCVSKGF